MNLDGILGQVYRNICGMKEVVGKKFLNHISFITKTYDKIIYPMGRIYLHDMPNYRHSANFYHRFRANRSLFP